MKKRMFALLMAVLMLMSMAAMFTVAADDETELMPGIIHKHGDINIDGKVNIKDVTLIQKHLAKIIKFTQKQLNRADVNGLRGLDIRDASHMQKWLAKLENFLFEPAVHQTPTLPDADDGPIVLPVVPAM